MKSSHTLPPGRAKLVAVIRSAGDVIRIADASATLKVSRTDAAKTLSRWAKQGWLRRVGSGAYVAVSLDSLASDQVLDDPWVLVPTLFSPGYIGGRTAAEHWDLTEQLFRDIVVLTAQRVRRRVQQHHGALFALKHIGQEKIFGTKAIWRGRTRIAVSDVHRTIVDIVDDPALGGGIQHVADCLSAYLVRPDRNDATLISYAARLENGAIFKRLGFLAERSPVGATLTEPCRARLTKGNAKLDPTLKGSRLITRWKLIVPETWAVGQQHD